MNKKYFGTDGIRGKANFEKMSPQIAMKAGMAAGYYFSNNNERQKVVIGKDTRLSGYMVEPALVAGFISVGMDVILVGPMPTPAVSMLARSLRADLGVMISASHNLYHDNGIKFFDKNGLKLSDMVELEIEKLMQDDKAIKLASSENLGRAKRLDDSQGRYIEFVKQTFPKRKNLSGLKVVLDCANGAAYKLGPTILWELEADVISIGVNPDGFNINQDCGSTSTQELCATVIKQKADIGIALDGDADRLIVCDEKGQIIDGDQLLALIATNQKQLDSLQGGGIVTTIMSNMGLEKYLNSIDLQMERTDVGDRHVAEKMRNEGYNVGGEQSGHIILRNYTTTGDGLIAALQVLAVVKESDLPASEVLNVFESYPQILTNVKFDENKPYESIDLDKIINECKDELGKNGRILIRKSGTEPLIRIMVEGNDLSQVKNISLKLTESFKNAVG